MPTLDVMADLHSELIRKVLRGFICIGRMDVPILTNLTTGENAELVNLGQYERLGNITKRSGLSFQRQVESNDTESWGQAEATRSDKTRDVSNVTFECQETRKAVLEAHYDMDLSGITPDPTTGEVNFAQPTSLRTIYRRILFVGADGYGEDEIYIGRYMPRWTVTNVADQSWGEENALVYGITGTAKVDTTAGYSVKHFFGGPGWKELLRDAGFNNVYNLVGSPTAGNYRFLIDGSPTADIPFGADAAAITAALEAIVGTARVTVSGVGSPKTVTFLDAHKVQLSTTGLTGSLELD